MKNKKLPLAAILTTTCNEIFQAYGVRNPNDASKLKACFYLCVSGMAALNSAGGGRFEHHMDRLAQESSRLTKSLRMSVDSLADNPEDLRLLLTGFPPDSGVLSKTTVNGIAAFDALLATKGERSMQKIIRGKNLSGGMLGASVIVVADGIFGEGKAEGHFLKVGTLLTEFFERLANADFHAGEGSDSAAHHQTSGEQAQDGVEAPPSYQTDEIAPAWFHPSMPDMMGREPDETLSLGNYTILVSRDRVSIAERLSGRTIGPRFSYAAMAISNSSREPVGTLTVESGITNAQFLCFFDRTGKHKNFGPVTWDLSLSTFSAFAMKWYSKELGIPETLSASTNGTGYKKNNLNFALGAALAIAAAVFVYQDQIRQFIRSLF